jgi:hypothetical protein
MTKIYIVNNIDKDPNKVYIGKTHTKVRSSQHRSKFGDFVEFTYIDEVESLDRSDWKPLECYWIEQFRQWGFTLLNKNKGGGGAITHSAEAREKIRASKLGKSSPRKGVKVNESTLKKMRDIKVGKKHSTETIKKMSLSHLGKPKTKGNTGNRLITPDEIILVEKLREDGLMFKDISKMIGKSKYSIRRGLKEISKLIK